MDHNLDDPLNLESDMSVDFGHSEDNVVNQSDLALVQQSSQEQTILPTPMDFEHNEDQNMLMDTGTEEIIVSDFIGDQFSLQEYSVQSDQTTGLTTTVESNQQQVHASQGDSMIDLQIQPQIVSSVKQDSVQHKIISVKTMSPIRATTAVKRNEATLLNTAPRQVAIAPKPPKLVTKTFTTSKQLPIAPKPVALITNRANTVMKKVSIANVVQGTSKGNTVLAQIGKQLIMVPSNSQKIKLVSSSANVPTVQYLRADSDKAQLIAAKNASGSQTKPVMTKVITVQGSSVSEGASGETPRYLTLQHSSLPLTLGNKVLVAAPGKQTVKITKKQEIISIKSPTTKLMTATTLNVTSTSGTKQKVVINPNQMQNVILKPSAASKTTQVAKDGTAGEVQRSQLHQINVPGKGIQYIRVVTNPQKPSGKSVLTLPSKTFMLSDGKGNLIQMNADKISPSLVVAGTTNNLSKVATKPAQKLVRIAPVITKTSQAATAARSSQSLLAPLSPSPPGSRSPSPRSPPASPRSPPPDNKNALRALIEKAVADGTADEVQIDFEPHKFTEKEDFCHQNSSLGNGPNEMDRQDSNARLEEHLIVIPSNFKQNDIIVQEAMNSLDDSQRSDSMMNIEGDSMNAYQSPTTPALSDTDLVATDMGLRPRKACNCTKSQCLKLYCDCFANGEFCNRCNCNNCHNNLENEELRQKAIRGCLDRNPNAFRPKIGKAKIGGPDIIRRHNKGCNCKRSGCLKNYCECYEAKIACSSICKCVGCRNVKDTLERTRRGDNVRAHDVHAAAAHYRAPPLALHAAKQPCSFMTTEVIEAVCQCLLAAAGEGAGPEAGAEPVRGVLDEFARCLQDIIGAAHHAAPRAAVDEGQA